MKLNKYSLFIYLICTLLLSTLLQTKILFNLNRILGFMLFFLILSYVVERKKKSDFYILCFSILSVTISFGITTNISTNLSNSIYWLLAIWLIRVSEDVDFQNKMILALNREQRIIRMTIIMADLILIYSLFSGVGYKVSYLERFFVGFTAHQHTLASAACFIICLVLVDICITSQYKKVKFPVMPFIFLLPALIAVLQSSARIFLLTAGILLVYIYLYLIEDISLKTLILPIAILLMGNLFMNSNVFERMINISGSNSNAYTSGRLEFWAADINAFLNSNIIHKIFGHGFEYVQIINKELTSVAIGAHNDYITLLLGLGLFGMLIYVSVLINEFKSTFMLKSIIKVAMLFVFWFVPSFINGFYGYQLLLYSYIIFKLLVLRDSNLSLESI